MLPTQKTIQCAACQHDFTYTIRYFDGKEVFAPFACDACSSLEHEARERIAEQNRRDERAVVFRKLAIPFCSGASETVLAQLPNQSRSAAVLRWKYGSPAPFLNGPSGQGKTRTMVLLLRKLWIEEGREFRFESWPTWQGRLEAAHRFGGAGKYREIKPLRDAPLLALDDVAKGKVTEHVVTAFFEIVDYRSSRGLPMIITTKYPMTKAPGSPLEVRLSEGSADTAKDIIRRLCEVSSNHPFIPVTP